MPKKLIYSVVKSISVLAAMTVASVGFTQDKYPSKPITFIMAVEAGADGDVLGRPLMDRVARILGQPITVINKPGAGSSIGYREIHQAKPDELSYPFHGELIFRRQLQPTQKLACADLHEPY